MDKRTTFKKIYDFCNPEMIYSKRLLFFFLIFFHFHHAFAQQSYFNVPSSDCTKKGTFFFQEQINNDHSELTSNSTFDWGIAKNFEAGLNLIQVNYNNGVGFRTSPNNTAGQIFPVIAANAQYFLPINERSQISIAGVMGVSALNNAPNTIAKYGFINYQFRTENIKLTSGIYSGNNAFIGQGDYFNRQNSSKIGFHIGTEINLWKHHLSLISDYISGTNAMGSKSLGVAYKMPKHWIISLGEFWANKNSNNPNGVVMEFTRVID